MDIWQLYHRAFETLEAEQNVRRPQIPANCRHNAHIYYLLVQDLDTRTALLSHLKENGVRATFHYVPLHNSPAGMKYGRVGGELGVTEDISDRLVRLPLGSGLTINEAQHIIKTVLSFFKSHH